MIFVANKPIQISSNAYLSKLKRKYKQKSMGFLGTLDPFASGCLIVANKSHSKLFRFLNTEPKTYIATIFFGAKSESLDDENITEVKLVDKINLKTIQNFINELIGEIDFMPPKFSAKHINGVRAYELARKQENFELKKCKMRVYFADILHYSHPFLTIKIGLSRGGYARSFAQILCEKLGVIGTLSALKRSREGDFKYENEKLLNIFDIVFLKENVFLGDVEDIKNGKKIDKTMFQNQENDTYKVKFDDFFSIFAFCDEGVKYILNKVDLC